MCGCCCGASSRGKRLAPQPAPCKTTSTTRRSSRRARTAAALRSTTTRGRAAASGRCSSASTSFASLWVSPAPLSLGPWAPRLSARAPARRGACALGSALPRWRGAASRPRLRRLPRCQPQEAPAAFLGRLRSPFGPLLRALPDPTNFPACT